MTWAEFKRAVEACGVKDEDTLWFIDWHTGDEPRLWETDDAQGKAIA